jgi:hypothetical protein
MFAKKTSFYGIAMQSYAWNGLLCGTSKRLPGRQRARVIIAVRSADASLAPEEKRTGIAPKIKEPQSNPAAGDNSALQGRNFLFS